MSQFDIINENPAPLAYRDTKTGEALLLVHAFPLHSAMWRPQLAGLSPAIRVIAPDLAGFGSSGLGNTPESLDRYADDLVALLDFLGLGKVILGGLSMGGYTAMAFLRRYPERVKALILADTRAGADTDAARAGREANALRAETEGALAVGEAMLPRLVADQASQELRDELRQIMAENSNAGVAAALRCMAVRPDSSQLLASLKIPTLILVGSADAITPPAEAHLMQSLIAGSQFVEIPGVGHLANLEAPDRFNAAVAQFIVSL